MQNLQTSKSGGFLSGLDSRAKAACALSYVVLAVSVPSGDYPRLAFFSFLLLIVLSFSGISAVRLLRRIAHILPFALLPLISIPFMSGGVAIFVSVLWKAFLSASMLALLSESAPYNEILSGLSGLGMPATLVSVISFMCRYLSVISSEAERMVRARDARSCGGNVLWHFRTLGCVVGNLFVRSYERSERVYSAMVARGYSGSVPTLSSGRITFFDLAASSLFLFSSLAARFIL